MAQISAVVTEEYMPIVTGRVENPEEMVAKYLRDLKAAGADTVLAEIQRQIDAWAAAK
jgi:putative aldouronate transport system substrate-binding protein